MINKELLNEVLELDEKGYCRSKVMRCYVKENKVFEHWGREDRETTVNIHELAHKCKEWAYKKSIYHISSHLHGGGNYSDVYQEYSEDTYFSCIADTEPEAIFKACQWIYEKING